MGGECFQGLGFELGQLRCQVGACGNSRIGQLAQGLGQLHGCLPLTGREVAVA